VKVTVRLTPEEVRALHRLGKDTLSEAIRCLILSDEINGSLNMSDTIKALNMSDTIKQVERVEPVEPVEEVKAPARQPARPAAAPVPAAPMPKARPAPPIGSDERQHALASIALAARAIRRPASLTTWDDDEVPEPEAHPGGQEPGEPVEEW
jgi:hypothetical protein